VKPPIIEIVEEAAEIDLSELQGPRGGNAYSPSTTAFTVPMPGETVEVTLADAGWIVVGMSIYAQGAGGSPDQAGIFKVVAKSGNTVTLLNPPAMTGRWSRIPESKNLARISS
jgi:hypothetical protein